MGSQLDGNQHPKSASLWAAAFIFLGITFTGGALANPVLQSVVSGNATVQQTQNTTTINQTSQQAVLNWDSFNIQQNQATHFQQPQGGIALNRIDPGQGASQIFGQLTATGQIILINQAGVYFGPNSYVNVGGIMASTADMSNQNFLAGNYQFNQGSTRSGSIINDGHIASLDHGFVILMGNAVVNNGEVEAKMGHVILGSGETFTVSFSGNDL